MHPHRAPVGQRPPGPDWPGTPNTARPVFANTEIFGAIFRRIHSEKGEIYAPKFVFGGPQIRIRRPCDWLAMSLELLSGRALATGTAWAGLCLIQ